MTDQVFEEASIRCRSMVALLLTLAVGAPSIASDLRVVDAEELKTSDIRQALLAEAPENHAALLTALISPRRDLTTAEKAEMVEPLRASIHDLTDPKLKARALNRISAYYLERRNLEEAERFASQALEHASIQTDELLTADALLSYAALKARSRDIDGAMADAERALGIAIDAGDPERMFSAHDLMSKVHRANSNFEAALEHQQRVLELAGVLNRPAEQASAHNGLALLYTHFEDFEQALKHFDLTLLHSREAGTTQRLAKVLSNYGLFLIKREQPERARDYLKEALDLGVLQNSPIAHSMVLANIGKTHAQLGENAEALALYQRALTIRQQQDNRRGEASILMHIGNLHATLGDLTSAAANVERARALSASVGAREEQLLANQTLASLYAELGSHEQAFQALQAAQVLKEQQASETVRTQLAELATTIELKDAELALNQQAQRQNLLISIALALALLTAGLLIHARFRTRYAAELRENMRKLARTTATLSESEARYRSVFNDSFVPKLLIDLESDTVVEANEIALEQYQLLSESLPALPVEDLSVSWLREAIADASGLERPELCITKEWRSPSGDIQCADIWVAPVSVDGRSCAVVMVHDTTEKRRLEEERVRYDKLQSLGTLAGGIAHNFNNSLFVVLGRIGLAKQAIEDGEPETRSLVEAERAVDESVRLANSLLTFSKGGEPRRELHDIGQLLQESARLAISGSAVELNLTLPRDLWRAEVDANQIRQLISNLILNGVEAMNNSGQLDVRASNFTTSKPISPSTSAGSYVRIQVRDTGSGVASDIRDKIMDPYFSTTDRTGLGLTSAFSIATRHAGWLTFESTEGKGSTFTVYLPAAEQAEIGTREHGSPTSTARILVMDDEPSIQAIYDTALANAGYEVVVVADGEAARDRYAAAMDEGSEFDLVIMDLTVPGGMGGREAMKAILQLDPDATGIVASGYSQDPVMSDFETFGFRAALAKPFSLSALYELIDAILAEPAEIDARARHND